MLVALDGRPEWLAIAAGGYLAGDKHLYIDGIAIHDPRLLGYGGGAAIAGACALVRYLLTRRAGAGAMTTDAVSASAAAASDLAAAGGAGRAGSAQDAAEPVIAPAEPVIAPAAVFAPTVTVSIGADGAPAFAAAGDSASAE